MEELLQRLFIFNVCPIGQIIERMKELGIKEPTLIESDKEHFIIRLLNDGIECLYNFTLKESTSKSSTYRVVKSVKRI